ncbi:MAG: hypothetical protein J6J24_02285 [Clostridia bacterium]|nr:hypothetical protein [Clostridia bacterium]
MTNYVTDGMKANFTRWARNYNGRIFNLDADKSKVRDDFLDRYLKGEFVNNADLVEAIVKSYSVVKPNEIEEYIDAQKMGVGIVNQYGLISKFLSDYVLDGNVVCKSNAEVYAEISDFLVDRMEEMCGDVIYAEALIPKEKSSKLLKDGIVSKLKEKGYVQFKQDSKFFLRPTMSQGVAPQDAQEYLLATYQLLVAEYVKNYASKIKRGVDATSFKEFWSVVEVVLDNYERRMSETTKASAEFLKAKTKVEAFFDAGNIEKIRRSCTPKGRRGDYYQEIYEALYNFKRESATEQDVELLKNFYHKVETLNKALSITDENGRNYPANYFVCMKEIHPANIVDILAKMQSLNIFSVSQKETLDQTKLLVRKSFGNYSVRNNGEFCDLRSTLSKFKIRSERDGVVIDNSTEDGYNAFIAKVDKYISENNLPSSDICAETVARDFMKGRENPINLQVARVQKTEVNSIEK